MEFWGNGFDKPSNDDNFLWSGGRALVVAGSPACLDRLFLALYENTSILLDDVELCQRIESWSVLDIPGSNIKASYMVLIS